MCIFGQRESPCKSPEEVRAWSFLGRKKKHVLGRFSKREGIENVERLKGSGLMGS
jgi:hypothetical protein